MHSTSSGLATLVNQDWLTLDTIWHVPSKDHLWTTSSSRLHHSKNTSLHRLVLKKTSRDYLISETLNALLALGENLGSDSAQNTGYQTELTTIYQHCASCKGAGKATGGWTRRAAAGGDGSRTGSQADRQRDCEHHSSPGAHSDATPSRLCLELQLITPINIFCFLTTICHNQQQAQPGNVKSFRLGGTRICHSMVPGYPSCYCAPIYRNHKGKKKKKLKQKTVKKSCLQMPCPKGNETMSVKAAREFGFTEVLRVLLVTFLFLYYKRRVPTATSPSDSQMGWLPTGFTHIWVVCREQKASVQGRACTTHVK